MLHREVCYSESLFYEIVMQRLCRQQIIRSLLVVARIVAAHDFPFVIVTQRSLLPIIEGIRQHGKHTLARGLAHKLASDLDEVMVPVRHLLVVLVVESESRAAFGLLFGAESMIQSLHMLHMGVKCRFMLHKVRMYEGP